MLEELILSDISRELLNNREVIDDLLNICIANKNYANIKKVLIHEEYSNTANIFHLQNAYSEALLELNEKFAMEEMSVELNKSVRIGFKFKDTSSIVYLEP